MTCDPLRAGGAGTTTAKRLAMHKKTDFKPFSKLSLGRETIRSLAPDELRVAAGGGSADTNCLMCPSHTWASSRSRTILG